MTFFIGRGFADLRILKKWKWLYLYIYRTVKNIVMKYCIHIDIDKM